ncbi:uncharacterized protein PSFLO_00482 [Pseudozyma flocculosa]|uniref:Uncharacterized protein n=1 Tax=Pseudozyma flocculosa TaxID=84751 RepID=A0A5C3EVA6_9BASI|nr:uncharacterized protein PSFLO_00482 [Pseudozyma flocculosa]
MAAHLLAEPRGTAGAALWLPARLTRPGQASAGFCRRLGAERGTDGPEASRSDPAPPTPRFSDSPDLYDCPPPTRRRHVATLTPKGSESRP